MAYVFETVPADRSLIDLDDPREVNWWSKRFGCSEEQLRRAVEQVGIRRRRSSRCSTARTSCRSERMPRPAVRCSQSSHSQRALACLVEPRDQDSGLRFRQR